MGEEFWGTGGRGGFSGGGRFSRRRWGRFACRGSCVRALLGGTEAEAVTGVDDAVYAHDAVRLCGGSRTAHARFAGSNDGGHCRAWRIFLSSIGTTKFCSDGSPDSTRSKTARLARFQLSIDFRGYRLHRGSGAAVAGKDGAAVCAGAARLERRDAGRRSRATRNPIQNRSAFAVALALDAPAPPAEPANGRRSCWRIVSDVSRVGVVGAHDGVAGRNVAVDVSRFSSHTIFGTAFEPCSRSADRHRLPTPSSYPGSR